MVRYIDVTGQLAVSQREVLEELTGGLRRLKEKFTQLDEVGIVGGFLLDILYGLEPRDIDIRYSVKSELESEHAFEAAMISYLKQDIRGIYMDYDFSLFNVSSRFGVEVTPKEVALGPLTYFTFQTSQLFLGPDGRLWTNEDAWEAIKNKRLEIDYLAIFVWLSFRKDRRPPDNRPEPLLLAYFTRGLYYMKRKGLVPTQNFLDYARFIAKAVRKEFLSANDPYDIGEWIRKRDSSLEVQIFDLIKSLEIENEYKEDLIALFRAILRD